MQIYFYLAALALVSVSNACTSTLLRTPDNIIERSAEKRPPWVEGDFSSESSNEVFVVFKKSRVFRLDLGLKQAQSQAILESKKLMLDRVKTYFIAFAAEKGIDLQDIKQEVLNEIEKISATYTASDAISKSVYYELLSSEHNETVQNYYEIYVLLTMPRIEFEEVLEKLATNLQKSGIPKVRTLGNTYLKNEE